MGVSTALQLSITTWKHIAEGNRLTEGNQLTFLQRSIKFSSLLAVKLNRNWMICEISCLHDNNIRNYTSCDWSLLHVICQNTFGVKWYATYVYYSRRSARVVNWPVTFLICVCHISQHAHLCTHILVPLDGLVVIMMLLCYYEVVMMLRQDPLCLLRNNKTHATFS